MNIYEDYLKYREDNKAFFDAVHQSAYSIEILYEDVLAVLDYVAAEYKHHGSVEADLEDLFDMGLSYLANLVSELEMMYHDYFGENIDLMNSYSHHIIYFFYLEDYKCHLDACELLTDAKKKTIDNMQKELEQALINKTPIVEDSLASYEEKLDKLINKKDEFHPVYVIFSSIRELLNLY
ncbi:MAG: hypothetical protein J5666_06675 [Bacilli bacterium]|nr:hypothetical protein [Bacilli bacterium]